jgi:hypothetical protein
MSQVIIAGDTSGTITLQAPAVSGSTTLTLPAVTGTVMVSGNMPAFSAYLPSNQTISANTQTKITISATSFDTSSSFNTSTNRYTPNVAGYYQLNWAVQITSGSPTDVFSILIKNGTTEIYRGSRGALTTSTGSSVIYFNGSTDYVELYIYTNTTGVQGGAVTAGDRTYLNGLLVRNA